MPRSENCYNVYYVMRDAYVMTSLWGIKLSLLIGHCKNTCGLTETLFLHRSYQQYPSNIVTRMTLSYQIHSIQREELYFTAPILLFSSLSSSVESLNLNLNSLPLGEITFQNKDLSFYWLSLIFFIKERDLTK